MMKNKYLWTILIAVLELSTLVWFSCTEKEEDIKGSIYGTVTDFATGELVSKVIVKLTPNGESTLTGSDCTFDFKGLKPGKYSLSISKAEYADLVDDYVISTVIDAEDQIPVNGASVVLRPSGKMYCTDSEGYSLFEDLDAGQYII